MNTFTRALRLLENLTDEEKDIVRDAFSKYCYDRTSPDYDGLGSDKASLILRILISGANEFWKKYDEWDDAVQAVHTCAFFAGYKEIAMKLPDEDLGAVIKAVFYSPDSAEFENPLTMEFYLVLCHKLSRGD